MELVDDYVGLCQYCYWTYRISIVNFEFKGGEYKIEWHEHALN